MADSSAATSRSSRARPHVSQPIAAQTQRNAAMQTEAAADLHAALPALHAAENALNSLNKNDLVEIKSFSKAPVLVRITMEAVCLLLGEATDWESARRVLGDVHFIKRLLTFDKFGVSDTTLNRLQEYVKSPEEQKKQSSVDSTGGGGDSDSDEEEGR